jgi:hypothetical protein
VSTNHKLPSEIELDKNFATLEVSSMLLSDGLSDEGAYSGTILKSTKLPHGEGCMVYDEFCSHNGEWFKGHWHEMGNMMNSLSYNYKGKFVYDKKQ